MNTLLLCPDQRRKSMVLSSWILMTLVMIWTNFWQIPKIKRKSVRCLESQESQRDNSNRDRLSKKNHEMVQARESLRGRFSTQNMPYQDNLRRFLQLLPDKNREWPGKVSQYRWFQAFRKFLKSKSSQDSMFRPLNTPIYKMRVKVCQGTMMSLISRWINLLQNLKGWQKRIVLILKFLTTQESILLSNRKPSMS